MNEPQAPRRPAWRSMAAGAAAIAAAAALTGCGSSAPADFTVIQADPRLTSVDLTDASGNRGDLYVFEAPLSKDGAPFGMLLGQTITAGEEGAPSRPKGFEERIATLVFHLPDGTISATGASYYAVAKPQMPPERMQVRAITGGTGAYAGARGELQTTRQANGTYQQSFRFTP